MLSEPHSLDKGCVIILMRLKYERTSQWPAREFNIGEKAHFQKKKIQCVQATLQNKHCAHHQSGMGNSKEERKKGRPKTGGKPRCREQLVFINFSP